ncbi:MAG TPA: Mur ligase family protein [Patescibacteria group bacterium]|nr:Mur ligase family protein [Patescibacteria group bacterium]
MNVRSFLAILVGKCLFKLSRRTRKGGGSALPGLIAERIKPDLLPFFLAKLPQGNMVVSGTNGKTTTARMISTILKSQRIKVLHNRSGSNLLRGILSTCIEHADFRGNISSHLGLWEVDEAVLPLAIHELKPHTILLTNLFRDQLDRYGEIDTLKRKWLQSLQALPEDTTVLLNADDPSLAFIGKHLGCTVLYFGLDDKELTLPQLPHAADAVQCPECQHILDFDQIYASHMGHYSCRNCGFTRPALTIRVPEIRNMSIDSVQFSLEYNSIIYKTILRVPGIYNVYNAVAAVTASLSRNIKLQDITSSLSSFTAAFGRVEKIQIGTKTVFLFLVKNPTGFNEVLRTILQFSNQHIQHLFLSLNDLVADGRDVSWIWDVDLELLKGKVTHLTVSGIRAPDLLLRLKYAEVLEPVQTFRVDVNQKKAFEKALDKLHARETLFLLPTYTAMLDIREYFVKQGYTHHLWKD